MGTKDHVDDHARTSGVAVSEDETITEDDSESWLAFVRMDDVSGDVGVAHGELAVKAEDRTVAEDEDPLADVEAFPHEAPLTDNKNEIGSGTSSNNIVANEAKVANLASDFLEMKARLRDALGHLRGKIRASDVWKLAGIAPTDSRTRLVARVMRRLGWEHGRPRFAGIRSYAYLRGSGEQRSQALEIDDLSDGRFVVRVTAPDPHESNPLWRDDTDPLWGSTRSRTPRKRSPASGDLTKRFEMRCTPQDFRRWTRQARALGISSVAAFLRTAANEALAAPTTGKKRSG